jgi:NTP pyrophosphatase (non-canonical NTP hydrolase)
MEFGERRMKELDKIQQLLVITMEECGELTQACSKVLRVGSMDRVDVIDNLRSELGDVYCMLELMVKNNVVSWDDLHNRAKYKTSRLKRWSDLIEET